MRNWTYVDDIVSGTILAAEKINDGTAVNLGTMERIRVKDAAQMVLENAGLKAEIRLRPRHAYRSGESRGGQCARQKSCWAGSRKLRFATG